MTEKEILMIKEKLMTSLNISETEALEVMAYDNQVEKGKATEYDLTAEQKKVASNMAKTGTRVYNFSKKREKKVNETKADLIIYLAEKLAEWKAENIEIANAERQICFSVGDNKYDLTLTQKRKKKE